MTCENCENIQRELDEFQETAKEYEQELDKEVAELKKQNATLLKELEECKVNLYPYFIFNIK